MRKQKTGVKRPTPPETAEKAASNKQESTPPALTSVVHELQVHKAELEAQNEELRRIQLELQKSRDRYFKLYDIAPVAYFTLGQDSRISELNLAASKLLGVDQEKLIGRKFTEFVAGECVDEFLRYRDSALTADGLGCELKMRNCRETPILAWLQSIEAEGKLRIAVTDIAQSRKTEEALRESDEQFRLATAAAHIMVYELNVDTRRFITACGLPELLGYQLEEVTLTQNWWQSQIHPDDLPAVREQLANAIASGQEFTAHYRIRHKNGHHIVVKGSASIMRDKTGRSVRVVGSVVDVTELKKAEEAIEESERNYRRLWETLQEGICVVDIEDRTTLVNRHMAEMLGYDIEEMLGKKIYDFMDEQAIALVKHFQAGKTLYTGERLELSFRHKDGRPVHTVAAASPLLDEEGNCAGIVAGAIDITDLKLAERELRQHRENLEEMVKERTTGLLRAEANLRRIVTSIPDGIVITDEGGMVRFANPAAEALFGYKSGDLVDSLFGCPVVEGAMEVEIDQPGGEATVAEMSTVEIQWEDKPAFLTSFRDIAQRKQMEKYNQLYSTLLRLFLEMPSLQAYLEHSVQVLRSWLGCQCLGIRLPDEKGNVPYAACTGFSQEFLETENLLSIERDQCACTRIITGRIEPQDIPAMTESGSFCCNRISEFVSRLSSEEKSRYKSAFLESGETATIVPIRYGDKIWGVIHIADERQDILPPRKLQPIEAVAPLIGEAIYRFHTEEELQRSKLRLAEAQQIAHLAHWDWDMSTNELDCSDEICSIFGLAPGQSMNTVQASLDLVHPTDRELVERSLREASDEGKPYEVEYRIIRPDGAERFVHERGKITFDESGKPVRMLGTSQDITELKRVENELRLLSSRLIRAQEEERRDVGRELHDIVGQSLTVLKLSLYQARHSPPENTESVLVDIDTQIDELAEQVRALCHALRPAMLDDLGLLEALLWHFERFTAQTGMRVDFKHSGLDGRFPTEIETAAYRIVQEALTNATRYSGVKEVEACIWSDSNALHLQIEDRGKGFDPGRISPESSGIRGMRERALLLGGTLTVDSAPGNGTSIICELPLRGQPERGNKKAGAA